MIEYSCAIKGVVCVGLFLAISANNNVTAWRCQHHGRKTWLILKKRDLCAVYLPCIGVAFFE